jgi:predicted DNA-binding transcriptional regulator YafY
MGSEDTLEPFAMIIGDLLRGERHSRSTIAKRANKSPAQASRWMKLLEQHLPDIDKSSEGRTKWLKLRGVGAVPSRAATLGVCIAASLATLFEGTQNERNLRDARDQMLKARGDVFADLDRKFVFAPRGGEYALPEKSGDLDEVIEALLKVHKLEFSYRHNDGLTEKPIVRPLSLLVFEHQFYVLCQRDDDSLYCFRFARMSEVNETDEAFEYPSKNSYDPRRVLQAGFGVHISGTGPILDILVRLREPWATFALTHRWHPSQDTTRRPDGATDVRLRVRHCRELETWVLGFGEHVTIVEPTSLREAITARVVRMVSAYCGDLTMPEVAKAKATPKRPKRSVRSTKPRPTDTTVKKDIA